MEIERCQIIGNFLTADVKLKNENNKSDYENKRT